MHCSLETLHQDKDDITVSFLACQIVLGGMQTQDLYDPREQWASYLTNALKAKELQIRDVNYIVRGEEVIIVDEFTGRTMPGRRYSPSFRVL